MLAPEQSGAQTDNRTMTKFNAFLAQFYYRFMSVLWTRKEARRVGAAVALENMQNFC